METYDSPYGPLTYDPETHIYTVAGCHVPSVSAIIRPINDWYYRGGGNGCGNSPAYQAMLAHAAERGQAVHEACWYFDQDDLDEETVDEEARPYVDAYASFKTLSDVEIVEIEQPRAAKHGSLLFAGRPDRVVRFKRGRYWEDPSPLDIKTTVEMAPAVGRQLAGYAELVGAKPGGRNGMYALQLRPDGTFRLHDYRDKHAGLRAHFLALLVHHANMQEYQK